jgi:uncharacterized protein (TIGR02246 family)
MAMNRCTIARPVTPEALHAVIEDALNRRDLDAFVAAYEGDAMLVVSPGGGLAMGRDNIRAAATEVLALQPRMRLAVVKKVVGDDTAVTYGRWRVAVTSPDGDRREMTGRGTLVSRRRSDGTWGIVLDDLGFPRSFAAVKASSTPRRRPVGPVRRVS